MTPTVQLVSVRQLFNDGNHNAFTDLCRFQNRYYLTFRNCPEGHMLFTTSKIIVMHSVDGMDWKLGHIFNVPNRDVRDPHFLVFDNKLFVYSGAWWVNPADPSERDVNDHLGFCVWSEDGQTWYGPRILDGTHGYYIWRAAVHNGIAYLNGRRMRNFDVVPRRPEYDAKPTTAIYWPIDDKLKEIADSSLEIHQSRMPLCCALPITTR